MKKTIILGIICLVAITAVGCKGKNSQSGVQTTTDTEKENTEQINKDAEEQIDNKTEANGDEQQSKTVNEEENTDSDNTPNKTNTEEERKNTYHDVDIKVPSIDED